MAVNYLDNEAEDFFHGENYIYRILTLNRFIDFKDGKMVFVSPRLWTDPYEKAFLEAKYNYHGDEFYHPLRPNKQGSILYSQCWTGSKQTEAMWRGFAPNEDGVMIKFHTRILHDILEEISNRGSFDVYIGKVLYENSDQLYDMKSNEDIWRDISNGALTDNLLRLLLKKREAFNFEDEFRLMVVRRGERRGRKITTLNVNNLLDRVEYIKFDPRMGEKLFEFTKESLESSFPDTEFHKSRLYSDPLKTLHFGQLRPPEINDEIVHNE